jgi:hypothetical protein
MVVVRLDQVARVPGNLPCFLYMVVEVDSKKVDVDRTRRKKMTWISSEVAGSQAKNVGPFRLVGAFVGRTKGQGEIGT